MTYSINKLLQETVNGTLVFHANLVDPDGEVTEGFVETMSDGNIYFKRKKDDSIFPLLSTSSKSPLKSINLYDEVCLGIEIPCETSQMHLNR